MEGVQAVMTTRNIEPDQWRKRKELSLASGRQRQLFKKYRIDSQTSHGLTLDGTRAFAVRGRRLTMAPDAVYEFDGRMDMGRKRVIFGRRGF